MRHHGHKGDAERVRRTKVLRWLTRELRAELAMATGYESNQPIRVAQRVAVASKLAELADVFARGDE